MTLYLWAVALFLVQKPFRVRQIESDIGRSRPSKSEGRRTLLQRARTAAWEIKPVSARLSQHKGEVIM